MNTFSVVFLIALALSIATKLWLGMRHLAHVQRHRGQVPAEFEHDISLEAHQKAADYTSAKERFAVIETLFGAAVILALTFGGGLQYLDGVTRGWFEPGVARGVALIVLLAALMFVVEIPFDW